MDLDFVEHEWKQEFHGTHYIILITRNGPQLNIEAEQLDTNERWSGEFSSNYVEEITHKVPTNPSHQPYPQPFFSLICRSKM